MKGTVASNYGPIICLSIKWKLLTGIFTNKIYDYLAEKDERSFLMNRKVAEEILG